uniref:Peptidase S1 domain-containing protein n=1 Tax=Loa loa TaxID=7209 RepID=A0A1I7VI56_LOALO
IAIPADYLTGPCLHNDIAIATVKLKMLFEIFENFFSKNLTTFPASLDDVACIAQPHDTVPNTFTLYSRGSDPTRMKKTTALSTINVTRIDCIPEEQILKGMNDQLCTSELQEANLCSGDSGSGLMFKTGNGIWNVAGVASAGTDCRIINIANNMKN